MTLRRRVLEDSVLLGCDAPSLVEWSPAFSRKESHSTSRVEEVPSPWAMVHFHMKAICSSETLEATDPATKPHLRRRGFFVSPTGIFVSSKTFWVKVQKLKTATAPEQVGFGQYFYTHDDEPYQDTTSGLHQLKIQVFWDVTPCRMVVPELSEKHRAFFFSVKKCRKR